MNQLCSQNYCKTLANVMRCRRPPSGIFLSWIWNVMKPEQKVSGRLVGSSATTLAIASLLLLYVRLVTSLVALTRALETAFVLSWFDKTFQRRQMRWQYKHHMSGWALDWRRHRKWIAQKSTYLTLKTGKVVKLDLLWGPHSRYD